MYEFEFQDKVSQHIEPDVLRYPLGWFQRSSAASGPARTGHAWPLQAGSGETVSQYCGCQRSCSSCRNGVAVLHDPPDGTPKRSFCLEGVLLEGFLLKGGGFPLLGLMEGRGVKPIAGRSTLPTAQQGH
ncbi:hypothetical protein RRG08_032836 [Elysia crispata]|uniref:Uncharacterized protein n=1 Tax=Elysia crispata TaxID=231223 RepID=A0AAE1DXU1_9GAST|nr:hypothetical protein RRG08_032836 [Elysia crispata]